MAAWLTYGIDDEGLLVSIDAVPRGRSSLCCPYCSGSLTAKKGKKNVHHFAHTGETCQAVARATDELPILPWYDRFNIQLSKKEFKELQLLWSRSAEGKYSVDTRLTHLVDRGFLKWNDFRRSSGYEFTKLGKIPVGGLSLMLFNNIQEAAVLDKLYALETNAIDCLGVSCKLAYKPSIYFSARNFDQCELEIFQHLADCRLYRAQLKRILLLQLYYIKVIADEQILYKIGVTRRPVDERIAEVKSDLKQHFKAIKIQVLDTWEHRGNVEFYFKYRYQKYNYPIGSLTEYFQFPDEVIAKKVLRELRRMKPKRLSSIEREILDNVPLQAERIIEGNREAYEQFERSVLRSQAIKRGMLRAVKWGGQVGRSPGAEKRERFLAKPKSLEISEALQKGGSLRKVAEETGAAINTVRKVKAGLAEQAKE
ncbi:MAG: GIY-YIG nuclease family protein [Cyanobacteria bacterium J06555_13]